MAEARALSLSDLREIVFDPAELAKGAKVFDEQGLAHLARFENKLYADARGAMTAPYKVQIVFEAKSVRGRCSCMAARTRPFCKHAAGLLVAWARAPESFAESNASPHADDRPKKTAVKRGKVDANEAMGRGVEQAGTLVRELAVSGVASLAQDRVDQVHALSESLREAKLRRVAGRTRYLAEHLAKAAARTGAFDASEYAELIGDILLTVRKLEKHLAGEALVEEHVEELIGKTWTKKDRRSIEGLDLVEYAFLSRQTSDDFVIRESRYFDVVSGEHFTEKQILPGFLAKRTTPKKSYRGRVLRGVSGSLFPSYPPRRLDLQAIGETEPIDARVLSAMLDRSLPSVLSVVDALQQRRRDVFAPPSLSVSMRASAVLADGARLRVVDASGAALFLPDDAEVEETFSRVLRGPKIQALLGDVELDGALPTLFPLAVILEGARGRELVGLGGIDPVALSQSRKLRREALLASKASTSRWAEVARAAGVSSAAIVLGEVREEMAQALATGLSAVAPRFADALAGRLRELGLTKQAELLTSVASRADPASKLDDFIKLHQVLGIALTRLTGAAPVDLSTADAVATHPSVYVRRASQALSLREVTTLRGAGKLNRYEALAHYARHYEAMPALELAQSVYPTWADGAASEYVARVVASVPAEAVESAERVLEIDPTRKGARVDGARPSTARTAKLTAIRVLHDIGSEEASQVLSAFVRERRDVALVARAQDALADLLGDRSTKRPNEDLTYRALHSASKDARIAALEALANGGHADAIGILRASFMGDITAEVRNVAAYALATLGDVESVDTFVRMLEDRRSDPGRAKVGARAIGVLGDVRGLDALLRAAAEGWQLPIVAEAIREIGAAALEPFLDLVEREPDLADKKPMGSVLIGFPVDVVTAEIARRLATVASDDLVLRASLYVGLSIQGESLGRQVCAEILAVHPILSSASSKDLSAQEKRLARKLEKLSGSAGPVPTSKDA